MIGNPQSPQNLQLTGGILVFFPSYQMMEQSINRWKTTDVYNRLIAVGGGVVIEPKGGQSAYKDGN